MVMAHSSGLAINEPAWIKVMGSAVKFCIFSLQVA